jgi:hypothetical protein
MKAKSVSSDNYLDIVKNISMFHASKKVKYERYRIQIPMPGGLST